MVPLVLIFQFVLLFCILVVDFAKLANRKHASICIIASNKHMILFTGIELQAEERMDPI